MKTNALLTANKRHAHDSVCVFSVEKHKIFALSRSLHGDHIAR